MGMIQIVVTVVMSVAIGLLMGVIGGGGGGIYVVFLLVFLHQDAKTAAMTALMLSTLTLSGASWQYWRKRQFRTDYFIVLSVMDIVGTLLGNMLLNRIDEGVLKIVIFCVLILSGLTSLLKVKASGQDKKRLPKPSKSCLSSPLSGWRPALRRGRPG